MGVKDLVNKVLIAGLGLGMPGVANAYQPGDLFKYFYGGSGVDTSAVESSTSGGSQGGFFQRYYQQTQEIYGELKKEWKKTMEEFAAAQAEQVPEVKKQADMGKVNIAIADLNAKVDSRVLEVVLSAWELSSGTRALLQQKYGSGLTDYQYKQLLFREEYNNAKTKASEICKQLGIPYKIPYNEDKDEDEDDVKEFALAYASLATLAFGIGRPNMNKAVDIATATMQANVDSSQWKLSLVMQYLPPGIQILPPGQISQRYVKLDYPKLVISYVYAIYGIPYVDYGSQVSPVQAAKPFPWVYQPPTQPAQPIVQPPPTQSTQPETPGQTSVQKALNSINSAINALQNGRQDEYNKKVNYFDPIIHYGWMLYCTETKSSTIDIILIEANLAGLVSYYQTSDGKWYASLTPEAVRVLKENYGYKDKGNWGKNIENLNKTLQEMADKRNVSGEKFDKTLAKALRDAGIYLVPNAQGLVDALNTKGKDGGVVALQNQITNYQNIQNGNKTEIDSRYDQQIKRLYELKGLVEKYNSETNPEKKKAILEEIGKFEAGMTPTLSPSVYEQITGEKYMLKEEGIPPAEEVLEEVGVPGYQEPNIGQINGTESQSNYLGSYEINVGAGKISAESVEKIKFIPRGMDYSITIGAYLDMLEVPPHTIFGPTGGVEATNLKDPNDLWRKAALEKIAKKINEGRKDIQQIIDESVREVEKEMKGGSRLKKSDCEFQEWRTAFFGKPKYKADGTPKAERRA